MYNLKNRSFLKLLDFKQDEIRYLLDLSHDLKRAKYAGNEEKRMLRKNIVLIYEKPSTRTRSAFEVAAYDQGACVTFIGPGHCHMKYKESVKDTARVFGRIFDAIEYRGFEQNIIEIINKYAGVPVWNGLTNEWHPTQILADFLTIEENFDRLKNIKMAYCGDGRSNVANSLLVGSAIMGLDFRIVSSRNLFPDRELVQQCESLSQINGGKIIITDSIDLGVTDVDVVYTDVWVSMGMEGKKNIWDERIKILKPYQVNIELMQKASQRAIFMHCLPAYHNRNSVISEEIYNNHGLEAMEVTDEVFESPMSVVFDQAENRIHTIKAVMVATIGN